MYLLDYECKTTFWEDFSIADRFGTRAIRDTYRRAFNEWKDNTIYLTELVMILNHKIWYWYRKDTPVARVYAHLYNDLWMEAANYAETNLTGDNLDYYFRTTD